MEKLLEKALSRIIAYCDPEQVILFGSYAKGSYRPGSDIDLLVIGDFRQSRYLRGRQLRDILREFPVKMDIHLLSPREVEIEQGKRHSFIRTMEDHRKILYQKKP